MPFSIARIGSWPEKRNHVRAVRDSLFHSENREKSQSGRFSVNQHSGEGWHNVSSGSFLNDF
jgi:hypothetical protein